MTSSFPIQRISDAALIRLIKGILATSDDGTAKIDVLGGTSISFSSRKMINRADQAIFGLGTFFIQSSSVVAKSSGFSMEFRRGLVHGLMQNGYANWHAPDLPFIDGVQITGPTGEGSEPILKAIAKDLPLGAPGNVLGEASAQSGELILQRLNDAVLSAVDHTLSRQRDLDSRREELDKKAEARLAAEEERLKAAYREKLAELDKREEEFKTRLAGIEDRSNTHVRRNLQKAMAELSQNTLKDRLLKRSEMALALPLFLAITAALFLIFFISRELYNLDYLAQGIIKTIGDDMIQNSKKPDLIAGLNRSILFGQVRVAFQTIGAGLLVWFALGLARQRYRQTSRWEHDLHRFRLDTERASFLIEGELEARKLNGMVLPEVVLDRFSRGLFTNGYDDHTTEGSDVGNTLAHLLARSAKLRIGPNGVEAEVDKAGIRKANKEVIADPARED